MGGAIRELPRAKREFRRMVAWSALVHVALLGFVLMAPGERRVARPRALSVELVARAPGAPKPRAATALPEPPAAVPAPPVRKEVVLPAKPRGPRPQPKAKRREVFVEPKPKSQEKDLEDLLADLREEAGDAPAEPVETARAPAPGAAPGAGEPVSAEVLAWVRLAKRDVRRAWIVPPGFRTQLLETHVVVTLDAAGNVIGTPRVTRRSGNPWYDEGVVRGIAKASPLPPPPEPGDWDFIFVPEDSL